MVNIEKPAIVGLSLLLWLSSCSDRPALQIKTTLPVEDKSENSLMSSPLQATVALSDEDWQKLNAIFQSILPRIQAMESSILLLPEGTGILIAEARAQLELSGRLLEVSTEMLEKTESLLLEAQKTRKSLEKLGGPRKEH